MNVGVFVLMLLFAFAGWQHARHLEKKYGALPLGWPDWVWAVVTGVSLLLGIVLLAVGERRLRKNPAPAAAFPVQGYGYPATVPAQPGAPVWQPATVPAAVPAAAPVVPALPPAGWNPDPSGRHQLRWWDGATWTSTVHTDGVTGTD